MIKYVAILAAIILFLIILIWIIGGLSTPGESKTKWRAGLLAIRTQFRYKLTVLFYVILSLIILGFIYFNDRDSQPPQPKREIESLSTPDRT